MVFKNENHPAVFMPGYSKNPQKYPITGRKGSEIHAIYCAGSRAGSKADGLIDLPEKLRAV